MTKKVSAILMCVAMIWLCIPQAALATETYTFLDEDKIPRSTEGVAVIPVTAETALLTSGWYVVDDDVVRSGTISVSGNVHLILSDDCTLTVYGSTDYAGIHVTSGNRLTIYGQTNGTGTLVTQGGSNGAGIGSGKSRDYYDYGLPSGTIVINGGIVNATGGNNAAGIGGGYYGAGGTTIISGGTINATGGTDAAGIGGGYSNVSNRNYSNGGTITINGGTVTANGKNSGAGIGGGRLGSSGTILITDGIVDATSGNDPYATGGAGIGGGAYRGADRMTITGGTVVGRSVKYGAGIGGGDYSSGGTIVLSGGDITGISLDYGAGIGGGWGASGGSVSIDGGTIIATSLYGGSGIGGGYSGTGGTINIYSGDITATGGLWGAGIGSGGGKDGGNINISGGTVRANGGDYGAGVGSGGSNSPGSYRGGNIQITGGRVIARGGASGVDKGLDIGRGRNGVNGTVLLNDAAVVELISNGIDVSCTTIDTCIIKGPASGSLYGAYENGIKINGILIDLSQPVLSSGTGYTASGNIVTLTGSSYPYVLFGSTATRQIIAASAVIQSVMLFALDSQLMSGCAFIVDGAGAELKSFGVSRLSSGDGYAGLQVSGASELWLYSDGQFTAEGGLNGAGIGGSSDMGAGRIIITGGSVIAKGKGGGAGIGGGLNGSGGFVSVENDLTHLSATGGVSGFDVGSGNGNAAGGSLMLTFGAALSLNRNGTNAQINFFTGTVDGEGAGLLAGAYLNGQKHLVFDSSTILPAVEAKAFESVTLRIVIDGLAVVEPEGYVLLQANESEIGKIAISRETDGSSQGLAVCEWKPPAGTYTLTAEYIEKMDFDNYYVAERLLIASDYLVAKAQQKPLEVTGIPVQIHYGDADFDLSVSGGSGSGALQYAVTSGDAVTVDASGAVRILCAGEAEITVTKAGDSNYEETSTAVVLSVGKATPVVVFPTAKAITYGSVLADSDLAGGSGDGHFTWQDPDRVPLVENSGCTVVFTPDDSDNYVSVEQTIAVPVMKAQQKPLEVTGMPVQIHYGDADFDLSVSGGSGSGALQYAVTSGNAVTVDASGAVRILCAGEAELTVTKAGDSNYEETSTAVVLSVGKATPVVVFPTAKAITYGSVLADSDLAGGSGDGHFSWQDPDRVPLVENSGCTVVFTPDDSDNYVSVEQTIAVPVLKAQQKPLEVTGMPVQIHYGDADFDLSVSGGSGSGALQYAVTSGNAIRISDDGRVSIVGVGQVTITVIKESDDSYHQTAVSIDLQVDRQIVLIEPTPSPAMEASPTPMPTQAMPVTPEPSHAVPITPTSAAVQAPDKLKPELIETDEQNDRIIIVVRLDALPDNTTSFSFVGGRVVTIDRSLETLRFEIKQDDLNERGELEIMTYHEDVPLAPFVIQVAGEAFQPGNESHKVPPVLIWAAVCVGILGAAGLAGQTIRKRK